MTGCVFDIQPFSTHDGPGIRTVVFLKGCQLHCHWCHNPEGISPRPQLSYLEERCTACGACAASCHAGVHRIAPEGPHTLLRNACVGCGACARACPHDALEVVGQYMTVDAVMERIRIDQPFFDTSGGGITLSGGEPLRQPEFSAALLAAAQQEGIHTLIETSGYAPWSAFTAVLSVTDGFLYDIKETDPVRHRRFTGVDNGMILDNLRRLHATGVSITLRLPIIPNLNDRPEHRAAVDDLLRSLPGLAGVDTIPYHPLGLSKVARFGLPDDPPKNN